MSHDKFYSFIMKGELTKVALDNTKIKSRHQTSEVITREIIDSLCLDSIDDDLVVCAKKMSTVYIAIASFENSVREFITKKLAENCKDSWWDKCVSDKIKTKAKNRKEEEEKIRWHTPRGLDFINYTNFGDLADIIQQNFTLFEPHIVSIDWAKQIFETLERSRNVIMHSGELHMRDIERVGTNMRDWINQVGA